MGKLIGHRWKQIAAEKLARFSELASEDTDRYKKEVKEYNSRQEEKMRSEALKSSSAFEMEKGGMGYSGVPGGAAFPGMAMHGHPYGFAVDPQNMQQSFYPFAYSPEMMMGAAQPGSGVAYGMLGGYPGQMSYGGAMPPQTHAGQFAAPNPSQHQMQQANDPKYSYGNPGVPGDRNGPGHSYGGHH